MAASSWWPTPAAPSKWFTAEQITNSRAFHRPPATMSKAATAVCVVLIFALGFWLRNSSADAGGVGYLGLVLTPLAVLVPLLGFNWWMQGHHRPSFGFDRPSVGEVVWASVFGVALAFVAINTLWIGLRVFGTGTPVLLVTAALAGAASVFLPTLLGSDEMKPMSPAEAAPFLAVADWARIKCEFLLDAPAGGANARATNLAGKRVVGISPELLERPAELQSLVVAHEVAHHKLNHLTKLRVLTALQWATVAGLGWLVAKFFGDDRLDEHWTYPFLAGSYLIIWFMTTPAVAFFRRHFERQADAESYEMLGTVPTSLGRTLHATEFANLEPDLAQKLLSHHPPVSERLELISRRIQTL